MISPTARPPSELTKPSTHCASASIFPVSAVKVEKVVNAPMNPVRINNLASLPITIRSIASAQTSPNRKHPILLTISVPHGNKAPE